MTASATFQSDGLGFSLKERQHMYGCESLFNRNSQPQDALKSLIGRILEYLRVSGLATELLLHHQALDLVFSLIAGNKKATDWDFILLIHSFIF